MKERESNLELMRIVLMCVTPAYHLLVYNLILKASYNEATLVTLLFCAAGAIPANYAFMAMSSYFLLETKAEASVKKFLTTAALVMTLCLVRFAIVRGLYGFHSTEYMVEGFITKGAWWYMDAYLLLLLVYPFLNRCIRCMTPKVHLAVVIGWFGLLILFFLIGRMTRWGDVTAFLFLYFLMGYLRRSRYEKIGFLSINRKTMLAGTLTCYLLLFGVGFYAKYPFFGVDQGVGNDIVQYVISRYNVIAALMGVCVFFLFRGIRIPFSRLINRIAASTVYVFLLHETWLSVFWYLGYLWFPMEGRPGMELLGWIVLFTAVSFAAAAAVRQIYERTVKKPAERLIRRIREVKVIKKIEELEANYDTIAK